jgi:hypothetical protein
MDLDNPLKYIFIKFIGSKNITLFISNITTTKYASLKTKEIDHITFKSPLTHPDRDIFVVANEITYPNALSYLKNKAKKVRLGS